VFKGYTHDHKYKNKCKYWTQLFQYIS
jgi:hypothetical protein